MTKQNQSLKQRRIKTKMAKDYDYAAGGKSLSKGKGAYSGDFDIKTQNASLKSEPGDNAFYPSRTPGKYVANAKRPASINLADTIDPVGDGPEGNEGSAVLNKAQREYGGFSGAIDRTHGGNWQKRGDNVPGPGTTRKSGWNDGKDASQGSPKGSKFSWS